MDFPDDFDNSDGDVPSVLSSGVVVEVVVLLTSFVVDVNYLSCVRLAVDPLVVVAFVVVVVVVVLFRIVVVGDSRDVVLDLPFRLHHSSRFLSRFHL